MVGVTWVWVVVAVAMGVSMAAGEDVEVQVQTRQGAVKGRVHKAGNGRQFYSFKSIPYAKPPVGPLRFRNPVPAGMWDGVLDGTRNMPKCAQLDLPNQFRAHPTVKGQEDCLYLNVFVPETTKSSSKSRPVCENPSTCTPIVKPDVTGLPVMVYIHAGVFAAGWAELYEPDPLMRHDVVVVVIQYRLNTLGFMSTEDSIIPGNLGLKDQNMALHWVKGNIRDFGGDPNRVTLFGETQGAASAHFHVLSPMSKGLFQRVILQSGTMLAPWAMWHNQSQIAIKVGQHLNCPGADAPNVNTVAIAKCLKAKPVDQLVMAQLEFNEWQYAPTVMKPEIDGEFLTDHPATLLREGRYNKVDIISGVSTDGGFISSIFASEEHELQHLLDNFPKLGPVAFCYQKWEDDPVDLARRTWDHYMGPLTSNLTKERLDTFTQLYSDILYNVGHLEVVKHHARDRAQGHKTYMYEFGHQGQYHTMDWFLGKPPKNPNGKRNDAYTGHSDDLLYLFNLPMVTLTSPEDIFVSRLMTELWVNFATTGDPTPDMSLGFKWDPVMASKYTQLAISTTPEITEAKRMAKESEFWRSLPTQVNKLLYPERFRTLA